MTHSDSRKQAAEGLVAAFDGIIENMRRNPLNDTRRAVQTLENTQTLLRLAASNAGNSIAPHLLASSLAVLELYDAGNGLEGDQALTPRVQAIHTKMAEAGLVRGVAGKAADVAGNSPGGRH